MSYYDAENLSKLVGRRILEVLVSKDREYLRLVTDQGPLTYYAEGDCCSSTWIESIDDPQALLGVVQKVENLPMPDLGSVATPYCPYPDSVDYYGLKITTDAGRAVIDYRNNSNGYYGGWLCEVDIECYGSPATDFERLA